MAGTIPLISHVPVRDPIKSKIIIAEVVELILLLIVSIIFFHFFPLKTPIITAKLADSNKAIWFGPPNDSSP